MELLVKSRLTEENLTMGSVIKMGNHVGNNFQLYWVHPFSPIGRNVPDYIALNYR